VECKGRSGARLDFAKNFQPLLVPSEGVGEYG
jgi:hypothetical protein